ncbi:MAG: transposase [Cyclobacteriaceae bacterium]|nr:transposase [Cyclobacteriaceae bacterium]
MTVEERRRRRFSEGFRQEQVRLIESGKISSREVCKLYQVKWDSVKKWLIKYGKKELPGKILISNGKEIDRIRELEKENRDLMGVIGKQQVELVYKTELIRLAKEKLGGDFEKK